MYPEAPHSTQYPERKTMVRRVLPVAVQQSRSGGSGSQSRRVTANARLTAVLCAVILLQLCLCCGLQLRSVRLSRQDEDLAGRARSSLPSPHSTAARR